MPSTLFQKTGLSRNYQTGPELGFSGPPASEDPHGTVPEDNIHSANMWASATFGIVFRLEFLEPDGGPGLILRFGCFCFHGFASLVWLTDREPGLLDPSRCFALLLHGWYKQAAFRIFAGLEVTHANRGIRFFCFHGLVFPLLLFRSSFDRVVRRAGFDSALASWTISPR